MSARTKVAAFLLALGAALGGGAIVGAAVGPIDVGEEPAHEQDAPHGGDGTGTTTETTHAAGSHQGWGSH